jgi:hypothetical protein
MVWLTMILAKVHGKYEITASSFAAGLFKAVIDANTNNFVMHPC